MGSRTTPLEHWLRSTVSHAAPGAPLPSYAELRTRFRLSTATIRHVVRALQEEGVVYAVRGTGLFVGDGQPEAESLGEPLRLRHSAAQHLAEALSRSIGAGELRRGDALPQTKYVAVQHRVSRRTVAAAYRLLAEANLVERIGKRYRIQSERSPWVADDRRRAVMLFEDEAQMERILGEGLWARTLRECEYELDRCNVELQYRCVGDWVSGTHGAPHLGYLVDGGRLYERVRARIARRRRVAAAQQLRVVLVSRPDDRRQHYGLSSQISALYHGNIPTVKARRVARYCHQHGFSHLVVLVDPSRCAIPEFRDVFRIAPELEYLNPDLGMTVLVRSDGDREGAATFLSRLRSTVDSSYLTGLLGKHKRRPQKLEDLVHDCPGLAHAHRAGSKGALRYFIHAEEAVEYCRWLCRVRQKERESLLAYGDTTALRTEGISAIYEDWRSMGYAAAHFLLGDQPVERSRQGYLRARMHIHERSPWSERPW